MDVQVTPLPGIGTREDFTTRSGHRVGVITHRDGHVELIVSRDDDVDACATSTPLTAEETSTLASLLGAPHLVSTLSELQRELGTIVTIQLTITPGSPYDGRMLADTRLRTRTGVSVVAVVRKGVVHPSPRPDFRFQALDRLAIVGTAQEIDDAVRVFEHG